MFTANEQPDYQERDACLDEAAEALADAYRVLAENTTTPAGAGAA